MRKKVFRFLSIPTQKKQIYKIKIKQKNVYLGSSVQKNGGFHEDINHRIKCDQIK